LSLEFKLRKLSYFIASRYVRYQVEPSRRFTTSSSRKSSFRIVYYPIFYLKASELSTQVLVRLLVIHQHHFQSDCRSTHTHDATTNNCFHTFFSASCVFRPVAELCVTQWPTVRPRSWLQCFCLTS